MNTNYTTPNQFRQAVRNAQWSKPTAGAMDSFVQANVVILPESYSKDFARYCSLNAKACPVLEILEPGQHLTQKLAQDADIRTDVPEYKIYHEGVLTDTTSNIVNQWRDDLVTFFLGCSFSFEYALKQAGIPVKHQDLGKNVPMYVTNIRTNPTDIFYGPMVVSMRPIPKEQVQECIDITSTFTNNHGAPIHVGNPGSIGITDITNPEYGEAVPVETGEVPVFWACGVTPQAVALLAKPSLMITHSPGHMFVSDIKL
ncbi:MAG: putative hydro-lyase [Dehalococcoidia bacterium]